MNKAKTFVLCNRAISIGALGTIATAVGQWLNGGITAEAALPVIIGAVTHLFVSPAEHIGT